MASSVVDVCIIGTLATRGVLMTALPLQIVAGVFAAAVVFTLVLDQVKVAVFKRLAMAEGD
jgi:H+-transporting ATPase